MKVFEHIKLPLDIKERIENEVQSRINSANVSLTDEEQESINLLVQLSIADIEQQINLRTMNLIQKTQDLLIAKLEEKINKPIQTLSVRIDRN